MTHDAFKGLRIAHHCKICGKTPEETKFYPSRGKLRATCGPCKAAKRTDGIRAGMPMHSESIRNLEAAKDWVTTTAVAKAHALTMASVRTGFMRLTKAGMVEQRRMCAKEQKGQGGARMYNEYRQTTLGAEWLKAYRKNQLAVPTPAQEPVQAGAQQAEPEPHNPRRTGNPWFDIGLNDRPNYNDSNRYIPKVVETHQYARYTI